jgi:hypothetical protein
MIVRSLLRDMISKYPNVSSSYSSRTGFLPLVSGFDGSAFVPTIDKDVSGFRDDTVVRSCDIQGFLVGGEVVESSSLSVLGGHDVADFEDSFGGISTPRIYACPLMIKVTNMIRILPTGNKK